MALKDLVVESALDVIEVAHIGFRVGDSDAREHSVKSQTEAV